MPEPNRKNVMISSTARDLPEHRKEVEDACLRQGMFPMMMEHLPASDAEAIGASLDMVNQADIYLGVFAHRYGYVPKGHDISVTEMEYNRAVERNIPRLIFVMGEDHPIKAKDLEIENAAKLKAFKERIQTENIVNFFDSPADLRAHAINSLSQLRVPDLTAFHYVSDIPEPPKEFIAHPYTLLQTHRLVGRQAELNLLTDWVAKPSSQVYAAHILNVVAIGGMGKSALTWKWFNEIAPQEMKPMAGRMWWSFYESDARFENFVTRALAYVTRRPLAEVEQIPAPDRETQLLAALDREPFLIVLDGLERILIAYARMDAARLDDSQVGSQWNLRKTADPRVGRFLKKLAQVKSSRILVSSRLCPAELETEGGDSMPGTFRHDLTGLTDEDAVELWRAFEVAGSRDLLLPVFATFDKHPLLIQALAGEVKRYRQAPGNFEAWRKSNPRFEPTKFPRLQDAMAHVLEFALRGVNEKAKKVLHTIAAFRMPEHYDTLAALLIGKGKPCADERELDEVLTELEDCGLVGWDKRANRYDLHPIVRGVVWCGLSDDARCGVYTNLHAYFEAVPKIGDWEEVSRLEDLTPAIELYNTLIGLGRYEDALHLYQQRLFGPLQFKLSLTNRQVEFLKMLFTDGIQNEPKLPSNSSASHALRYLAESYHRGGQPGLATEFYTRCISYDRAWTKAKSNLHQPLFVGEYLISHLQMLSDAFQLSGAIHQACLTAFQTLIISRAKSDDWHEAIILSRIGLNCAIRGNVEAGRMALYRSLRMFSEMLSPPRVGGLNFLIAQLNVWLDNTAYAKTLASRAWELAQIRNFERDFIRAARVQGAAALGLRDFATADERLHHALTRARQVNYAEEELPALIALAELRRQEGKPDEAREFLDDVWESAERGPYPLFHADACNMLAQLERNAGNTTLAIAAATQAYRLAWCDGPPFAYHWGLEAARKHLRELGAPEPELPPFDPAKFEPMPEVEIDPEDEFHAGQVDEDGTRM